MSVSARERTRVVLQLVMDDCCFAPDSLIACLMPRTVPCTVPFHTGGGGFSGSRVVGKEAMAIANVLTISPATRPRRGGVTTHVAHTHALTHPHYTHTVRTIRAEGTVCEEEYYVGGVEDRGEEREHAHKPLVKRNAPQTAHRRIAFVSTARLTGKSERKKKRETEWG